MLLQQFRKKTTAIHRYGFLRYLDIQRRKLDSRECWFLAIRQKGHGKFWEDSKPFHLIVAPDGHFYADPCLVKKDDTNYLFFEQYDFKSRKGTIACAIIDKSGACSNPETVLEKNYISPTRMYLNGRETCICFRRV